MLLRHSLFYLLARGIPGLINFLALAVYTRLLAPDEYGYYALALAVVGLANVVVWQWLRVGLLRFLAGHEQQRGAFLSTVAGAFVCLVAASACLFILAVAVWPGEIWLGFASLALLLLWAQAWFELNLELARSGLSPLLYGGLASVRSVLAIAVGTVLAYQGFGAVGVLAGLLCGFALPGIWMIWRVWRVVRVQLVDQQIVAQLARYGLPLTATFALGYIVSTSDRLLIGGMMGPESAGFYAVGYDLAAHTLGVLMSIVNLAAYPVVVRTLEREGYEAACRQLQASATLMLLVALPVAIVWMLLAHNVAAVVVDRAYVDAAATVIPIVALATLVSGFQRFHFDLAFQLGKSTTGQVWVMLVAALLNIILNLLLIPRFGLAGAAYATLLAYGAGVICSWLLGRRVFVVPLPAHLPGILAAAAAMALVLWTLAEWDGVWALAVQLACGSFVYATVLYLYDVAGIRRRVAGYLGGSPP